MVITPRSVRNNSDTNGMNRQLLSETFAFTILPEAMILTLGPASLLVEVIYTSTPYDTDFFGKR